METLSEILCFNKTLTFLNVSGNSIANSGLEAICKGLKENKTLLTLGLAQNDISPSGCEMLRQVIPKTAIKHLDLSRNHFGNLGCERVAKFLDFSNSQLTKLDLHECSITSPGFSHLYVAVKRNDFLQYLILDGNDMQGPSLRNLKAMLDVNQSLEKLSVQKCFLGEEGGIALAEGL